ncbi:hypothetical protein AB4Z33_20520 [Paenibacillus sp. 2TAB19]|jgi:p-aminobenzoyl-glutamate transporter AbgT
MRRYNFIRPLILIVTALLTKSLITNLCMLFGLEQEIASNLGFMAMIAVALIIYTRMMKKRRK